MTLKDRLEYAVRLRNDGGKLARDYGDDAAKILALLAAAHYAAGSFAQVPADKTVPPIVLHDCREHLEEAIAAIEAES